MSNCFPYLEGENICWILDHIVLMHKNCNILKFFQLQRRLRCLNNFNNFRWTLQWSLLVTQLYAPSLPPSLPPSLLLSSLYHINVYAHSWAFGALSSIGLCSQQSLHLQKRLFKANFSSSCCSWVLFIAGSNSVSLFRSAIWRFTQFYWNRNHGIAL